MFRNVCWPKIGRSPFSRLRLNGSHQWLVAHVRIFAAAPVAIPFRHGHVPAVRHLEEHFLRWRQNFRRDDFLSGLRVRTAAQFAIGRSGHRGCGRGSWRTKFGHARQARGRGGGDGRRRKRQLDSHNVARVEAHAVTRQRLESIALHEQQIISGREVRPAEHAVRVRREIVRVMPVARLVRAIKAPTIPRVAPSRTIPCRAAVLLRSLPRDPLLVLRRKSGQRKAGR